MTADASEAAFQRDIIGQMIAVGWQRGDAAKYDRALALYPSDCLAYVKTDDNDVPPGHPLRDREEWSLVEKDANREAARRDLSEKRFDVLMKEFFDRFPDGLQCEECDAQERRYKMKGVEYARDVLDVNQLEELVTRGEHGEVMKRTRRVLGKVNLAFPQELMRFDDIQSHAWPELAERIVSLVVADRGSTPDAVERLASALAPHGAAKWPVVTLIPFLLRPESAAFVKPTAIQRAAKALGLDVEYDPVPNARTYGLVCEMCQYIADLLADRGMAARDFIDVQTFLWFATGMAREMREQRAAAPGA